MATRENGPEQRWLDGLAGRRGPRYRAIADALAEAVAAGTLAPGTRLPPQRDLAYRLGVTVGTVTRAYADAEQRGLIAGEVGRGTFVRDPGRRPPGAELVIDDAPADPAAFIDMSINSAVLADEQPIMREALHRLAGRPDLADLLAYQPHLGMAAHRRAAAAWLSRDGFTADPERLAICTGSQNAMALALAAVARPGDTMLTEPLTYAGFKTLAAHMGVRLHPVAMDGEGALPESIDAASRAVPARALYLMPTLQNPITTTMGEARRHAIVRVARARNLMIVEDDVYGFLVPDAPPPFAALAPERTWHVNGLSKSLFAGLRIGFLIAPAAAVDRVATAIRATQCMASPLTAALGAELIGNGELAALAERRRQEAAWRMTLARQRLAGYELMAPPVAFHAWLSLPEPWRASDFVELLARRGVRVWPAETFAIGRAPASHGVRLCVCGVADRGTLATALDRVSALLADPETVAPFTV